MCGIVGIAGIIDEKKRRQLSRMRKIISHRGPDDFGEFFANDIALGHQRLSILDLSSRGKNPMFSNCNRYVIVFNGEIFNFKELKLLIGSRYQFNTNTDTEVLLASFIIWGKDCLKKLTGMFAFSIWDNKEKTMFSARDRLGIKPYFYRTNDKYFYFSSEIKSLLINNNIEPCYDTIFKYLNYSIYDHSEKTFFKDIYRLMPGCYLIWKDGELKISKYWDLAEASHNLAISSLNIHEKEELLKDKINRAISLSLRADVPLGINVSGGLDSSILTSLIDKNHQEHHISGFSMDYHAKKFSERAWVEKLAKRTQRPVYFSYLTEEDVQKNHQLVSWHQGEPFGGIPVISYIGLYQAAQNQNIKVLLDGNGIDECFAGYRQYHNIYLHSLLLEENNCFNKAINSYCKEWNTSKNTALEIIKKDPWKHNILKARDGTSINPVDWLNKDFENKNYSPPPEFEQPFATLLKNAMYQDLKHTKIPRALRFNDHISMAFSKELRVPFLDHNLVEFAFSLQDQELFTNFRPKGIIRNIIKDIVPDSIRLAPKRHIQTPQNKWFEAGLNNYVQEILNSSSFKQRSLFNDKNIQQYLNSIKNKKIANSFFLWQIVDLEMWFRLFIDSPIPETPPGNFSDQYFETFNHIS